LQAATVVVPNPAADLTADEELGIDEGLFEEDLTLFGVIGNGVALALAQCEEHAGCAPNVTEEELVLIILALNEIFAKTAELCDAGNDVECAERDEARRLLDQFESYQTQLAEWLDDASGKLRVKSRIVTLGDILNSINARISFFKTLLKEDDSEKRADLIGDIGILFPDLELDLKTLTDDEINKLIDGAKIEKALIKQWITQPPKPPAVEAQAKPIFTAESRDYSQIQNVAYGPSVLNLGEYSKPVLEGWY
jgi:hypothetical protein